MNTAIFSKLTEKYPFITIVSYGNEEYIGIVQNRDSIVTNFYDYNSIKDKNLKQLFLDLGEQYWWESSRQIPINIFLRGEWSVFKKYLRTFNTKETVILHGPVVSLEELSHKKTKKRCITLVKRT